MLCGVLGAAPAACGSGSNPEGEDFIGDNPGASAGGADTMGSTTGAGTTGDSGEGGTDDGGGERAIAEADIIQIEGDRLYALSQYGGLTVIDVTNPDQLPVLGRHRAHAMPFEMYVDASQVFVMYSDWGTYAWDDELGGYAWRSTTRLAALDASTPSMIEETGSFEMPGSIQDSRRVGDVLYIVTYEDGWCWGCQPDPNTTITSLDVSDPGAVEVIDQISFVGNQDSEFGGQRSVSATNERMYVAGIEYDGGENGHSVIDVIDISDPGGVMVRGASVDVAGQISSRWQMDEYEGILRVVSQPWWWNSDEPPTVETFTVTSSDQVEPLASLQMVLPRPESLQSVRFDGERGYAITFEQTDPLFTLDLSDPASPQQVGELEIPGFVYHMEPRGDRILGLGFDRANPEGSINVSLFDVSQFDTPTMLSRVHFGGDWADFGEDQNRIHKAFTILDDEGLLLIPFSGWEYDETESEWECYGGEYRSGIQLVDWADDALTERGVADSSGRARRALLHRNRLLGVSDLAVETFDITDRDAPARTADLALATNVSKVAVDEALVARLSTDWWTTNVALELTQVSYASEPEPLGRLDLSPIIEQHPYECGYYGLYDAALFVQAGFVYIVRAQEDYENWELSSTVVDVIDARAPANPVYVRSVELPFRRDYYGGYYGFESDARREVMVGNALVLSSAEREYSENGEELIGQSAQLHVLDLTDPANPVLSASIDRADAISYTGMLVVGDEVVSSHMRRANEDGSKVRHYLDRLDVSNPAAPTLATPVNVPGEVLAFDAATEHVVTVDFQLEEVSLNSDDCWSHPKVHQWNYETERCFLAHRTLRMARLVGDGATLVASHDVEGTETTLQGVVSAPGRLFARVGGGYTQGWAEDGWGGYYEVSHEQLVVFDAWEAGTFDETARVEASGAGYWLGRMHTLGTRLLFDADNGLGELDATDPTNPQLHVHDLYGYGCSDLELVGNRAYCAMGEFGLQTLTF